MLQKITLLIPKLNSQIIGNRKAWHFKSPGSGSGSGSIDLGNPFLLAQRPASRRSGQDNSNWTLSQALHTFFSAFGLRSERNHLNMLTNVARA